MVPNSCNLYLYQDGGAGVALHADDEGLFQGKARHICIVSLSLGAARLFEVRGQWPGAPIHRVMLENRDLLTMEGAAQQRYEHRVPRSAATEPRINLTWRWLIRHHDRCP